MSDIVLRQAETDAEVAACFPVMAQLWPHLAGAEELVARVARQRETGYCILAAWCDGKPVALAGYRVHVNLIYGKFLYVDDLVTEADRRRSGLGARLGPGKPVRHLLSHDRRPSFGRPRNRGFESGFLQRQVRNEPSRADGGTATSRRVSSWDDDFVGTCDRLQPGGNIWRLADHRLFLRSSRANQIAHDREARRQPDADW
jgi:hypothetical protein